jgi:hypothetical protein
MPHAPSYIPGELCVAVGRDPSTPPDECMALVKAGVAAGAVSAPQAEAPAMREVVEEADRDGIDLKIVVLTQNPAMDTALRDVATVVGGDYPGSTVLVLSPTYAGSYSEQFDRAKLEIGEDHAKTGNPVHSAHNFVDELNAPEFPWTAFTVVLLIGAAAAVVGTRMLQKFGKASAASVDPAPQRR